MKLDEIQELEEVSRLGAHLVMYEFRLEEPSHVNEEMEHPTVGDRACVECKSSLGMNSLREASLASCQESIQYRHEVGQEVASLHYFFSDRRRSKHLNAEIDNAVVRLSVGNEVEFCQRCV